MDLLADRIYFGGNQNEEKSSNNLMQIQSAIIHFQILKIEYHSSKKSEPLETLNLLPSTASTEIFFSLPFAG